MGTDTDRCRRPARLCLKETPYHCDGLRNAAHQLAGLGAASSSRTNHRRRIGTADGLCRISRRPTLAEGRAKGLYWPNGHSNVTVIYGLERSSGTLAIVMELVQGDDLSQRIGHGTIPIDERAAPSGPRGGKDGKSELDAHAGGCLTTHSRFVATVRDDGRREVPLRSVDAPVGTRVSLDRMRG